MAKKAKRPAPVQDVKPGADPYDSKGRRNDKMGMILGSVCLMTFIWFKQLWIGILVTALSFLVLLGIQIFGEKSEKWYTSPYLYAALLCGVMTWLEYSNGMISNLLKLG